MQTLCIDIGNTRIKYALYEQDVLQNVVHCTDEELLSMLMHLPLSTRVMICTVRQKNEALENKLAQFDEHCTLSHVTKLPIAFKYSTPDTLGTDRIALACAASKQFPNENTLVISLGTCITYNFVEGNTFIGGAISPGLAMRHKAMHQFTQKLPDVAININAPLIANGTTENLQSGAFNGMLAELHGIIEAYGRQYPRFNVVLTGGNITQFAPRMNCRIFADENFLFSGLYSIAEFHFGAGA
ncbi:MAG: hypothetical protein RL660_2925 [Bacteroidota bacterium]|jgi:type III pantothenate kinase